jgi:hypothetical protein
MLATRLSSRPRQTWIVGDAEHHDMDALRDRHHDHEVAVTSTERPVVRRGS